MFIKNFVKNILGVVGLRRRTKEEKINRMRKRYGLDTVGFAIEVFEIEGLDKIVCHDEWYRKLIDICADYRFDWVICNNEEPSLLLRLRHFKDELEYFKSVLL